MAPTCGQTCQLILVIAIGPPLVGGLAGRSRGRRGACPERPLAARRHRRPRRLHRRRRCPTALPGGRSSRCSTRCGCLPPSRWVGDHAWRRVRGGRADRAQRRRLGGHRPARVPVTALGAHPPARPQHRRRGPGRVAESTPRAGGASGARRPTTRASVVITSNYGEAGALARYGPALGLPAPYSGQNELGTQPGPTESTRTVVFVGLAAPAGRVPTSSPRARSLARLDNGVGVANEEQGAPVALCLDPLVPWARLWPHLAHLD